MKIISLNKQTLKEAVLAIKNGQIIIFPTDTVYGLFCDATNKKAVNNLFKVKQREKNKSLPILISSLDEAKRFAKISNKQEKFLCKVWPGKVTTVLQRKKMKLYGVDKETIALRIPKYKLVNALLEKTGQPVVGTSANISGKPASTKINTVIRQFENKKYKPDIVFDKGNLKESLSSAVIDLTKKEANILRQDENNQKLEKIISML